MADLQKQTPRHVRERRAYRLAVTGGSAGVLAAVAIVLAAAGVIGATIPILALIVAVLCLVLFRRTIS